MGGIEVTGDVFLKETVGPDLLPLLLSGHKLVLLYTLGQCPHAYQRPKQTLIGTPKP